MATARRSHFGADGSEGLKGFGQVPVLKNFAVPAFMVLLGEGKQAHHHQSRQDKSGYEVLHHGYHSTGLAHYVAGDRSRDDDRHGRGRQCAARGGPGRWRANEKPPPRGRPRGWASTARHKPPGGYSPRA